MTSLEGGYMSYFNIYEQLKDEPFEDYFASVTTNDVKQVLAKTRLNKYDFLTLLAPAAEELMEEIAQKAHKITVQNFGKTILLFTPLYLSDYCVNKCVYCSYSVENKFERKKLTIDEIEIEAKEIAKTGLKHVLILTGESNLHTPVSYLMDSVEVLKKYFTSVSIEVNPLETEEYSQLVAAGVDGLTVYQEVYNQEIYKRLHLKGPKRNYQYRLDAAERGCKAGMRNVNIGALLGFDDWRKEVFFTGIHAAYLQEKYLETDIGVSFPRLRPYLGSFQPDVDVTDKNLVQSMLALRIFLPRIGITLSTRESAELRDQLLYLGVTKMSAGSSTSVGGYAQEDEGTNQFEISDERTVSEVYRSLLKKGYQPVFKDWHILV